MSAKDSGETPAKRPRGESEHLTCIICSSNVPRAELVNPRVQVKYNIRFTTPQTFLSRVGGFLQVSEGGQKKVRELRFPAASLQTKKLNDKKELLQ